MEDAPRAVPPEIQDTFRAWGTQVRRVQGIHVSLLIAATVFSILAAASVVAEPLAGLRLCPD